jgi:hypothetical protein
MQSHPKLRQNLLLTSRPPRAGNAFLQLCREATSARNAPHWRLRQFTLQDAAVIRLGRLVLFRQSKALVHLTNSLACQLRDNAPKKAICAHSPVFGYGHKSICHNPAIMAFTPLAMAFARDQPLVATRWPGRMKTPNPQLKHCTQRTRGNSPEEHLSRL